MSFNDFIANAGLTNHDWQQQAFDFCITNEQSKAPYLGIKGGLIADEMGLGKTIVMLGICACNQVESTLIVLPSALMEQWKSQLSTLYEKAGINRTVLVIHGTSVHKITQKQINEANIVLTTYGTMSSTNSIISKRFSFKKWDRIIYDEAHHMRNTSTNSYKAAIALQSRITWLVTGTPINNGVIDFWNIMQIIGLPDEFDRESSSDVRKLLGCCVIKRSKISVGLDIPGITIHNQIVPWLSEEERSIAFNINAMIHAERTNSFEDDYTVPEKYNIIVKGESKILALMIRAKQSCTCPRLITDKYSSLIGNGEITTSKITFVTDLIRKNKNGRRKLVFCHFNEEIKAMNNILSDDYTVAIINGSITGAERNRLMTSNDIDVLILQIQSCCEGLNLQQYSEIYFISPSWNPCVEDQAIARAHRVGQTQPVDVYRFTMADFGSVENIETYSKYIQESKRLIASEMYDIM